MKRISISLLTVCLLGVGCTSTLKRPQPDRAATAATKPADDETAVPKLLPKDQLDAKNARAQAQLLGQTLEKENTQTDSASH